MTDPIAAIVETLYVEYADKIRNYIYRRTSDNDLADDLTAETFCKAMAAMVDGYGPKSSVSGWLYRIAHNLIIDYYRKRDKAFVGSFDALMQAAGRQDGDLGNTYVGAESDYWQRDSFDMEAAALDRVEWDAMMARFRNALTANQATVMQLRWLDGYSFAEVAEMTGRAEGAVKALQHRALENMRARVGT